MSVTSADASRPVPDRPRLLSLPNGEKLTPMFSREEIDRRLSKLRGWMEEASIDACLFTSIHNVNYFADYVYCSFGRHYGLVVTHDAHSIIGANLDFGRPWRRSFADNVAYTDWHRDNFFVAVRSLCPHRGRVGIELDHLDCAAHAKLEAALPDAELVDAGEATMRMRMIKSAEEQALIRNGAAIADIGGAACVEAIAEDVPEHDVALHATRAMVREIAHRYPHAELMDSWVWFQSGVNTDGAHNPVTTRRVARGDVLSLNCFPMIAGYYHALERTLFFHHVPDESLVLWKVNCEVHGRGIELIRPGVRCMDIARELQGQRPSGRLPDGTSPLQSRKLRSCSERLGWRSFRSAFASICRMRSRVTSNCLPTSSSVWSVFISMPKRIRSTLASRGVSPARMFCVDSRSPCEVAESAGETMLRSSMKSPRCESSSSPMGVSIEIGSFAILSTLRTFSSGISIRSASSSGVGSRPFSWRIWREMRLSLLIVSIMCTGMRMVRA